MAQQFDNGSALEQHLSFFVSCRNLPKLDLQSPSDPFLVMTYFNQATKKKEFITRTRVQYDNSNPDFPDEIDVVYKFEEYQIIHIDVYDKDNDNLDDLTKHDYVGFCEFAIGDLVSADNQSLTIKLKDKKNNVVLDPKKQNSTCIIRCEEKKQINSLLFLQLSCSNLVTGFFSSINPSVKVLKQHDNNSWITVAETSIKENNKNPVYEPLRINVGKLCGGDYSKPLLFQVFNHPHGKEPQYQCEIGATLTEILDKKNSKLKLRKRNKNGNGFEKDDCGTLNILQASIPPTFLDYIMGGMSIQLMVGIDFTGSNGNPKDQSSLHYLGPPKYESEYLAAIRSVGRVLEPYDTDNMIAVFGFGARLSSNSQVSHCFPLTFNEQQTEVQGVTGVELAYQAALQRIQLYGPTWFSEIIGTSSALSDKPNNDDVQNYSILLLLTDGKHDDKAKTIQSVIQASGVPLSIILVAVGKISDEDCANMEQLDADDEKLQDSSGKKAIRDIVQFVKFRDVNVGGDAQYRLAKETLAELPNQIVEYMQLKKVSPMKLRTKNPDNINIYEGPTSYIPIFHQDQLQQQQQPIYQQQQQQQPIYQQQQQQPIYQQQQQPIYQQQQQQPIYQQQQPIYQQQQQPIYQQQQQPIYQQQQPIYQQQQPIYQQQQQQPIYQQQQVSDNNNQNIQQQQQVQTSNSNSQPSAPSI